MSGREVRDDRHGSYTNYVSGCRCEACGEAQREYQRAYREANREKVSERYRAYHAANREKISEYERAYREANREKVSERYRAYHAANRSYKIALAAEASARYQAESLASATVSGPWQPHEDALLARVPSNIAAASALSRTYSSVVARRRYLRTH